MAKTWLRMPVVHAQNLLVNRRMLMTGLFALCKLYDTIVEVQGKLGQY